MVLTLEMASSIAATYLMWQRHNICLTRETCLCWVTISLKKVAIGLFIQLFVAVSWL